MSSKTIHLVCNAHLDPVWLWEWQEGAGEALSTFRTAADFCEEFGGFVFCHNEAVLYRWVEEHEPALFARIRRLVRRGRWHIMGGWHLQPDCNLPSGESFVRQILLGKRYFRDRFGVDVTTAVNLDPFGHSRGLVQILAKSGYDSYLCCRPGPAEYPLPRDEFVWVGFDGSEILVCRASAHYNSFAGGERRRLEEWIARSGDRDLILHLWGIGDHGGGPSRRDLEDIEALRRERPDLKIVHSTPTAFFEALAEERPNLARRAEGLNPWAVGCYTSMARVKRAHRRLENELFSAGKMAATAWAQKLMGYPADELRAASEDLAFAQFHDILPGSAIPAGEDGALRLLDHGLEILSRVKARAFFALAAGERAAGKGEIPVLVHNPHPFPIDTVLECEFEPHEPNFDRATTWRPVVRQRGRVVPSQVETEESHLGIEWRKKIAFQAALAPGRISRYDVMLERVPAAAEPKGMTENASASTVFDTMSDSKAGSISDNADIAGLQKALGTAATGGTKSQPALGTAAAHGRKSEPALGITIARGTKSESPRNSGDGLHPENELLFKFRTESLEFAIDADTGLVRRFAAHGVDVLAPGAVQPLVILDDADPWGMKVTSFRRFEGAFRIATPEETAALCGVEAAALPPVRVVEDGPVRSVVEVVMAWRDSRLVLTYRIPKRGAQVEIEIRVFWAEKDRMLKLSLPTVLPSARFLGQTAYGVDTLPSDGGEAVAQKWVAVDSEAAGTALTIINDATYGSDFADGELRLSLLRSPAYAAETTADGRMAVARNRFVPRQDQGERLFRFWIEAGPRRERLERIDREALIRNEAPYVLAYFPPGNGRPAAPGPILSDKILQLAAFKKSEDGDDLVLRLFNPTDRRRSTTLALPFADAKTRLSLGPFEIATLRFDRRKKTFMATDLLENEPAGSSRPRQNRAKAKGS